MDGVKKNLNQKLKAMAEHLVKVHLIQLLKKYQLKIQKLFLKIIQSVELNLIVLLILSINNYQIHLQMMDATNMKLLLNLHPKLLYGHVELMMIMKGIMLNFILQK